MISHTRTRFVTETVQAFAEFKVWDENAQRFTHFKIVAAHDTDLDIVLNAVERTLDASVSQRGEVILSADDSTEGQIAVTIAKKHYPDSKINAIKEVRELTHLGLKEAKDAIDAVWNDRLLAL